MRDTHRQPTLGSKVYQNVRRQISSGVLQPGQPMSRRRIASEMRTSLLPAAHALQRLEFEGLLESRPRAGTRVRVPSREDILDHVVVWEALETQAATRTALMASSSELSHLEALARELDQDSERIDARQYASLHRGFHVQVAAYSRCSALYDAVDQCLVFAALWLAHAPRPAGAPARHQDVARAISSRDPVQAAQAVTEHFAQDMARAMEALALLSKGGQRSARPFRGRRRMSSTTRDGRQER
jgi:DNA-binding GntR family transcriptional regulator